MSTGWLAWTCVLLATSAPADDVVYLNQRGFQIPIRVQPERQGEVRELVLWLSRNQGQTWEIYGRAKPDRKHFDFLSAGDGLLYFSVAVIDRRGQQDPPDIYKAPIGQKIMIDTVKPAVKIHSAERVGSEIQVSWEVREEFPDWPTLRLEYRTGDTVGGQWTPLGIRPGPQGNIKIPASQGEVTVRLSLRDLAGNEAVEEKIVPGTGARQDRELARVSGLGNPVLPVRMDNAVPPPPVPPSTTTSSSNFSAMNTIPTPPVTPAPVPAPVGTGISTPTTTVQPTPSGGNTNTALPPTPTRGSLPTLQIINKKQLKLGFDVSKFGPSGLGSVDVYITSDEGATWEKMPGDPAANLPVSAEMGGQGPVRGTVTVQVPRDGMIYGFFLVVKSRAGLGKAPPRAGDAPQVRVEVDVTQPMAELYQPTNDTGRRDALVLRWKAEDRNIADNPISLEWSERPTGPWEFIGDAQLPNTGAYTWQVSNRIPAKVFLKLTVRDKAGNVAVAQTSEPVLIDLSVPMVNNVVVQPQ